MCTRNPRSCRVKANAHAQQAFLERYADIKANKGAKDPLYFMDGVHPQHNTLAAHGWIKRGCEKEIKSNSGRQRLSINGAMNIETLSSVVRMDDRINAQSTLKLFKRIEAKHGDAGKIYVICDNARYYRARIVKDYLLESTIELVFLPAYSPNLNLIERYWKFFKKQVLYNCYYPTFEEFQQACLGFFRKRKRYRKELESLLAENFQIIGA